MRPFACACLRLQTCVFSLVPLLLIYGFPDLIRCHQTDATHEDLIAQEDHNHHRLLQLSEELRYGAGGSTYEPDFIGADRSIIGRAPTDDQALVNNVPGQLNIEQGQSQFWSFSSQALSGLKSPQTTGLPSAFPNQTNYAANASSDGTTLYISLNTCLQPSPQSPDTIGAPDQLKLYVSTSSDNQQPDNNNHNYAVAVDGGFGWLNITSVKNDVYIGVVAPNVKGFTGVYNYELTTSIDRFYASYYDQSELYFVDSDTTSALLYTSNTTNSNSSTLVYKNWMSLNPPPFTLFVQNQNNPSLLGMQKSYCALKNLAQVSTTNVDTIMTSLNNGQPQQQFHAKALNGSSSYYAILGMDGNSTDSGSGVVGGGGIVWNTLNFTTKQGISSIFQNQLHIANQFSQIIIVCSCSTYLSAAPSLTPRLAIPRARTHQYPMPLALGLFMTNMPSLRGRTSLIRLDKLHAIRHPPPNTPWLRLALTVRMLTKSGYALSSYRDVRTSQTHPHFCSHGQLVNLSSTRHMGKN